jgi:hypothetical protein
VKVIGRLQVDTKGVIVGNIVSKGLMSFENVGDFIGFPTDRFCRNIGEKEKILMELLHCMG